MKKTISIGVCIALIASLFAFGGLTGCASDSAQPEESITITMQAGNPIMSVNGTEKEIDPGLGTFPILRDDRTLVPIRAIIEEMGGTADWDGGTQTAILVCQDTTIRLVIGQTSAVKNDTVYELDVAPEIINGRTFLPLRFIAEGFGFQVDWNPADLTITIAKQLQPEPVPTPGVGGKVLVAYFSRTGNTQTVARMIQEAVGGDLFEIETVNPYPEDYTACTEQAQQELAEDFRPELSSRVEDMDQYDVVFVGYPIWWGHTPMAIRTFLESYDLAGKTVIPFCTHGGSGISNSQSDVEALCPDSIVLEGLAVSGSSAQGAQSQVEAWLERLELLQK